MLVVGIDPGVTGAVGIVQTSPHLDVTVWDIPSLKIKIGRSIRDRTDIDATWALLQTIAASAPDLVVIEDIERGGVRPMQRGQVALGKVAGVAEGMAVALGLRRHLATPSEWKAALRLKSDKDETRRAASRLLPAFAGLWPLGKHHNRAEAALLAWYGATHVLGFK